MTRTGELLSDEIASRTPADPCVCEATSPCDLRWVCKRTVGAVLRMDGVNSTMVISTVAAGDE